VDSAGLREVADRLRAEFAAALPKVEREGAIQPKGVAAQWLDWAEAEAAAK
jgi:hypothetical protein